MEKFRHLIGIIKTYFRNISDVFKHILAISLTYLFYPRDISRIAWIDGRHILDIYVNPIKGGGPKRLWASSSLNFKRNNHRMRL